MMSKKHEKKGLLYNKTLKSEYRFFVKHPVYFHFYIYSYLRTSLFCHITALQLGLHNVDIETGILRFGFDVISIYFYIHIATLKKKRQPSNKMHQQQLPQSSYSIFTLPMQISDHHNNNNNNNNNKILLTQSLNLFPKSFFFNNKSNSKNYGNKNKQINKCSLNTSQ